MKPQIVLDTNVLVAALRSRRGAALRLVSLLPTEHFEINLSVPLVLEYEEALSQHGHGLGPYHY
jgi:predicted nucleic acid-binding protein